MALNKNKILKKYYSIGEVAKHFGVSESLLRYWEKEFPNIRPGKNERNTRRYTLEDMEQIQLVYHLLKVKGMKISAARDLLSKNKEGAKNTSEMLDRLMHVREELMAISQELKDL